MKDAKEIVYYLAGPMTGLEDHGRARFNEAEKRLRMDDCNVLNPACLPDGLPDRVYMPICLAMVRESDVVVLLDGWENSQGARLEWAFALQCGKACMLFSDITGEIP